MTGLVKLFVNSIRWMVWTILKSELLSGKNDRLVFIDSIIDGLILVVVFRNATGPKASLFVPEGAFEILVRKQIAKLEAPALQCVDQVRFLSFDIFEIWNAQVYEELQKIVEKCELSEMARFATLRDRLLDVVKGVLRRCLHPTNQMISNLIQVILIRYNMSANWIIIRSVIR